MAIRLVHSRSSRLKKPLLLWPEAQSVPSPAGTRVLCAGRWTVRRGSVRPADWAQPVPRGRRLPSPRRVGRSQEADSGECEGGMNVFYTQTQGVLHTYILCDEK